MNADDAFSLEHPELPVNRPIAKLLQTWRILRPTVIDDIGQPLFLTKYKRRFKESGIVFIFYNYARKQHLNPADTHSDLFRKLAIRTYLNQGGNESGLRDYFGCRRFVKTEEKSDPAFFMENERVAMLMNEINHD